MGGWEGGGEGGGGVRGWGTPRLEEGVGVPGGVQPQDPPTINSCALVSAAPILIAQCGSWGGMGKIGWTSAVIGFAVTNGIRGMGLGLVGSTGKRGMA